MYKKLFSDKILELKENGSYREFTEVNRISSKYPLAKGKNGQEIIVFCSNGYLGMSQNENVINKMEKALKNFGAGSGGSRNIGGSHKYFKLLEDSTTHILPVIIGGSKKCTKAAKLLFENFNIYVQAINSPTVAMGTERFRINVTPNHTEEQMDLFVNSIVFVFNQLKIKRSEN